MSQGVKYGHHNEFGVSIDSLLFVLFSTLVVSGALSLFADKIEKSKEEFNKDPINLFYNKINTEADVNPKDGEVSDLELKTFYDKVVKTHGASIDKIGAIHYENGLNVPIDSVYKWVMNYNPENK